MIAKNLGANYHSVFQFSFYYTTCLPFSLTSVVFSATIKYCHDFLFVVYRNVPDIPSQQMSSPPYFVMTDITNAVFQANNATNNKVHQCWVVLMATAALFDTPYPSASKAMVILLHITVLLLENISQVINIVVAGFTIIISSISLFQTDTAGS